MSKLYENLEDSVIYELIQLLLDRVIENGCDEEVIEILNDAVDYYINGWDENATEICEEVLNSGTGTQEVELLLAIMRVWRGEHDQGLKIMKEFLQKHSADPLHICIMAAALLESGQGDAALELLDEIDDDEMPYILEKLCFTILYESDKIDQAWKLWKALILEPDHRSFTDEQLNELYEIYLIIGNKLGSEKFKTALEAYQEFILRYNGMEIQEYLLRTVVLTLCDRMEQLANGKYFITFLKEMYAKDLLPMIQYNGSIDHLYSSIEASILSHDTNVSPFIYELTAIGSVADLEGKLGQEGLQFIDTYNEEETTDEGEVLFHQLMTVGHKDKYMKELIYVRENYPHVAAPIKPFIDELESTIELDTFRQKIAKQLQEYIPHLNIKELINTAEEAYRDAYTIKRVTPPTIDGIPETYRREQPKVGRNDPCPCGSGKKYKKCCGR